MTIKWPCWDKQMKQWCKCWKSDGVHYKICKMKGNWVRVQAGNGDVPNKRLISQTPQKRTRTRKRYNDINNINRNIYSL